MITGYYSRCTSSSSIRQISHGASTAALARCACQLFLEFRFQLLRAEHRAHRLHGTLLVSSLILAEVQRGHRIVADDLARSERASQPPAAQRRRHRAAEKHFGSIRGGSPLDSTRVREIVRARIVNETRR